MVDRDVGGDTNVTIDTMLDTSSDLQAGRREDITRHWCDGCCTKVANVMLPVHVVDASPQSFGVFLRNLKCR